jgi:hypothetical protein
MVCRAPEVVCAEAIGQNHSMISKENAKARG